MLSLTARLDILDFVLYLFFLSPPFPLTSILGCPIARKRRLEEAEAEQEQEQETERPGSKRKSHPLKLALDEGFSAESDVSSEAEGEGEKGGDKTEGAKGEEEVAEGDTSVAVEREEMAELTPDGQTNEQEEKTPQKEEEEFQQEENFAADEGIKLPDNKEW